MKFSEWDRRLDSCMIATSNPGVGLMTVLLATGAFSSGSCPKWQSDSWFCTDLGTDLILRTSGESFPPSR